MFAMVLSMVTVSETILTMLLCVSSTSFSIDRRLYRIAVKQLLSVSVMARKCVVKLGLWFADMRIKENTNYP